MKKHVICGVLIDGSGEVPKELQVITVEGDRIERITDYAGFEPESDSKVLDLRGYTVIPGLVDCHDHLCLDHGDEAAQSAQSDALLAIVSVNNARRLIESGITTMRSLGEKNFIDVDVKAAVEAGIIPGPRMLIACRPICRTGGHAWFLGRETDGVADMRKAVREQIKMGADLIKIMISGGMSTEGSVPDSQEFSDEEIIAAVEEAHRAGRKIAAHIHGGPGLKPALEAGIDSVEHGGLFTADDVALVAEKGTYLVSTGGIGQAVVQDPNAPEFYRKKMQDKMDKVRAVFKTAKELGVKIAVGNDTHHARMDMEVQFLIDAGFSPMQALQAATRNGADLCGILNEAGTIETNKWADLVAVNGSPLEDPRVLTNPVLVMKGGQVFLDNR